MRAAFIGIMTAVILFAFPAFSQELCSGILMHASRDFISKDRQNAIASSIYSEHCEGSSAKNSSSTSIGVDAIVKAIPIKFNFGGSSSSDKLSNFCRVYNEKRAEFSSESIDSSLVVRESLEAFNNCISLSANGIYFSTKIGRTNLVIDVRRGSDDAAITGVSYDTGLLQCRLHVNGGSEAILAGVNTVYNLTGDYIPVVCERVAQPLESSGAKNYPRAEVIIATSRGSFFLPISGDADMPLTWASDISERISNIEFEISNIRQGSFEDFRNGKILASIVVKDNNVVYKSPGVVSYERDSGILNFKNEKKLNVVPMVTDTFPKNGYNYITETNFASDVGQNSIKITKKTLDTGDRVFVPDNFSAVVIGY